MLQDQIIASKIEELKKLWRSISDKLSALQQQEVLETRAEECLRLGQLIVQIKTKREQVEREMLQLEALVGDDGRKALLDNERLQQVMDHLPERAFEVLEVIQVVGLELKRMKRDGVSTEYDRSLLETTEQFLAGGLDAEEFIRFVKQLKKFGEDSEIIDAADQFEERTESETYDADAEEMFGFSEYNKGSDLIKSAQELPGKIKESPEGQNAVTQNQTNTVSGVTVGGNFEFKPVQESKK